MNPVQFAVERLSAPMGEHGSSMGHVISGALNPNPALEVEDDIVYVDAATPQEAIRQAFVGSLLVDLSAVGKPNTSYTYSPATVGLAPAEHTPYLIQPLATTTVPLPPPPGSPPAPPSPPAAPDPAVSNWQIALEDMAAFPEADYDYNDHAFAVEVTDLEYEPTGSSVISGKVWDDTASPDGTSLGDPGAAKVAVELYRNGVSRQRVYTDTNGTFSFPQLPDGDYRLEVASDPFRPFVPMDMGSDSIDSDVTAEGLIATFHLDGAGGSTKNDLGAGFRSAPSPDFVPDGTVFVIPSAGGWRFNQQVWAFQSATELRVAKWEKAFTSDGGVAVLIEPDEFGHDFIDIDPDRFFVLVKDSTAGATLSVTIETTHPTAAAEYKDNATTISLTKLANLVGWGNWYLSDSQMLVSNQKDDAHTEILKRNKVSFLDPQPFAGGIGDDNVAPNGGLNHKAVGGGVYDFAVGDRTHIVALGGGGQGGVRAEPCGRGAGEGEGGGEGPHE